MAENPYAQFRADVKPVAAARLRPLIGAQAAPVSPAEEARLGIALRGEERAAAQSTWRTMTPQEVSEAGLQPSQTYQINAAGKIEAIGSGNKTPPKNAAFNLLQAAGVDPTTGADPVADLIKGSTSGAVEAFFANRYGDIAGEATPGMQNISRLKTIVSDMTLQLTGGSLGAGVSNADVAFLKERVGNLADPDTPANARLAAWQEVKNRLARVAGVTLPGAGVTVTLPNGSIATFPNKTAAEMFKRKAGIR
jgi:hypothetical protein